MRSIPVAVIISVVVSSLTTGVAGTPPTPPMTMQLSLSGPPVVNTLVQLTFEITAVSDNADIQAVVEIPDSFAVSQPILWRGDLLKGKAKTFTTMIEALQEGYWLIRGTTIPYHGVGYPLFVSTFGGEEEASRHWWDVTPRIDFFGNFDVEGVPSLNSIVNLTYTLTSSDPKLLRSKNTTIHTPRQSGGTFSFPTGAEFLTGSISWAGKLIPGDTATLSFSMKFIENRTVYLDMENEAYFDFYGAETVESYPGVQYRASVRFDVDQGTWKIDREGPTPAELFPQSSRNAVLALSLVIGVITAFTMWGLFRKPSSTLT